MPTFARPEFGAPIVTSRHYEGRPRAHSSRHILAVRSRGSRGFRAFCFVLLDADVRAGKSHTCHQGHREHSEDEHSLCAPEHDRVAQHENGANNVE